MHSPRRSASPDVNAGPNSSTNQPGRSPPSTSPSDVAPAHRTSSDSGTSEAGAPPSSIRPALACAVTTASSMFSRQR